MFAGSKTVSSERNDYIMKATGIVRRIDDLGRVVIPKEIRRTMRIREGTPLEIFTDREGQIILKKYSPMMELGSFAKQYAESVAQTMNQKVAVSDRDQIIAVAGGGKRELQCALGHFAGSHLRLQPPVHRVLGGRIRP